MVKNYREAGCVVLCPLNNSLWHLLCKPFSRALCGMQGCCCLSMHAVYLNSVLSDVAPEF